MSAEILPSPQEENSSKETSSSSSSSSSSNTVIFVSGSAHLVPAATKLSSPIILKIKAHISPEHRFKVDLDQKFADVKREHEGREDLAYSQMVQHPVTVSGKI